MGRASNLEAVKVTVVVPCKNEETHIVHCVESLFQLTFSGVLEVVIVDGASTDKTLMLLAELKGRFSNLKVLSNPNGLTPVSMNIGIRAATGSYVMIASAHSEFDKDYLDVLLKELTDRSVAAVGGVMETKTRTNSKKTNAIIKVLSHPIGVGGSKFRTGVAEVTEVDTVPFGLYDRELLLELGGYDERLIRNQDIELSKRILTRGGKIYLVPSVSCYYYAREEYRGIGRNNFRNGFWNLLTLYITKNFSSLSIRHFVPFGFVSALSLSLFLGFFWNPIWIVGAAILLVYLLAITAVSIKDSDSSTSALHMIIAFIVLHVSYGSGSLFGMLRIDKLLAS